MADVVDSKSTGGDTVPVRVRPPAPRRSKLCIACSDFFKVRARSRRYSSFPNRNRLRWVAIWIRRCAADLSRFKNIDFNRPFQNERTSERMSFRFGFRPPKAASALRYLNARSRQSRPCAILRRYATTNLQRKRTAGQTVDWILLK